MLEKPEVAATEHGMDEGEELETLRFSLGELQDVTKKNKSREAGEADPEKMSGLKKKAAVIVLAFASLFGAAPEAKAGNIGSMIRQSTNIYQNIKQRQRQETMRREKVEAQKNRQAQQREAQMDRQRMQFCQRVADNPRVAEDPQLKEAVKACTAYLFGSPEGEDKKVQPTQSSESVQQ